MVDVSALSPNPRVAILAKLEGWNPGGSVKDRAAKAMVEEAEKDGSPSARPADPRVVVGQHRHRPGHDRQGQGLPDQDRAPRERVGRAAPAPRGRGGPRSSTRPGSEGSNGAMRRAQALAAEHPDWWFPYQYGNPANPKAHYESTGPEIWRDCPEITHFVAGLGTAGTLMGVGRFLKERNPLIQVWAVAAARPGRWSTGSRTSTRVSSRRSSPTTTASTCSTAAGSSGPARAIEWTRRLTEVGIFAGISSGAIMAAAVKCAERDRRRGDRHHRLRRRLEVPLHRRLDRRHRRWSPSGPGGSSTSEPTRGLSGDRRRSRSR